MKNNAKDIEKNIKLLKKSLDSVHDFIKIHTYWLLLEELMNDNLQNIDYVMDRWNLFNNERVKKNEQKIKRKERIIIE
jgi:hypothetical protein